MILFEHKLNFILTAFSTIKKIYCTHKRRIKIWKRLYPESCKCKLAKFERSLQLILSTNKLFMDFPEKPKYPEQTVHQLVFVLSVKMVLTKDSQA